MTRINDKGGKSRRVAEPVQVYLDADDQARLARITSQLDTSKSEVLRRGLEALERQLSDPDAHPVLQIIGLAAEEDAAPVLYDVAREHDRQLTDAELASWDHEPGPASG